MAFSGCKITMVSIFCLLNGAYGLVGFSPNSDSSEYSTPDMKTLMQFAKQSGKNYDMKLVASIANELLKNY